MTAKYTKQPTQAMLSYLSVIHDLDTKKHGVRSVEVARALNISRASVHSMLARLIDEGYAEKEFYGLIHLTELGREIGKSHSNAMKEEIA